VAATNMIPPQTQAAGTDSGQGERLTQLYCSTQNAAKTSRLRSGQVNAMTLTVRADPQGGSSVKQLFHNPKKQPIPALGQTHRPPKTAKLAKLSGF
jgi:hypothetical protein